MQQTEQNDLQARRLVLRCSLACSGAALGLGASLQPATAAGEDAPALRLAQAVHDRPVGRDLTTLSRMVLLERGRAPRERELVAYRLDQGNGETANLMRFLGPEDIAGTGLLSVSKPVGEADQWLYLPALDRVRRIAGDRKGGRFVGSDLYFEDLQERAVGSDRHRLLGEEAVAGVNCQILESTPVSPDNSVYVRRVSWVDPQTLVVLRVDYFERDERRPAKRWLSVQRKRTQSIWTTTESVMTNLESGHETRLLVERAQYNRKLPARLFSARSLGDETFEAEYRP
jgi:hypothetical protein